MPVTGVSELDKRLRLVWEKYAAGQKTAVDEIYDDIMPFCLKVCSRVSGKFVNPYDDEASIARLAILEAMARYEPDRGSILLFLAQVVKSRVLDHKRREKRWYTLPFSLLKQVENPVDRQADDDLLEILNDMDRKQEIEHLQLILGDYGISFADLVASSPKHRKTREETRQIALLLAQTEELKQDLREKKVLPVKQLIELGRFKRKTLERYRKYIIASAIILAGDFPNIQPFVLSRELPREGRGEPPSSLKL